MSYVLASDRPWCAGAYKRLQTKLEVKFYNIESKSQLNNKDLDTIKPKKIFFPFWSSYIPNSIYNKYECIIFHMTDLPYGRGGSPLQNLIVKGHEDTTISAIKCVKDLDAGPIYLKKKLSLKGNASEIYYRCSEVIESMIEEIIEFSPELKIQKGKIVNFKRRKPEDGNLINAKTLDNIYNHIRMLDAEGYPPAFIINGEYKIEFKNANKFNDCVTAMATIKKM
jgi:methionyl-tRNA formyltransferase